MRAPPQQTARQKIERELTRAGWRKGSFSFNADYTPAYAP